MSKNVDALKAELLKLELAESLVEELLFFLIKSFGDSEKAD